MGIYHILVNDSAEQYIDPTEFPNQLGPKHDTWMICAHSGISLYMTAVADFVNPGDDELHGSWAGDEIRFLGSTHDDYHEVQEEYTSLSVDIFEEMNDTYDWFPEAVLDGDGIVNVTSPEETRRALNNSLELEDN